MNQGAKYVDLENEVQFVTNLTVHKVNSILQHNTFLVYQNPKTVWAATFEEYGYTNPVDTSKIKFKILEAFYKLN